MQDTINVTIHAVPNVFVCEVCGAEKHEWPVECVKNGEVVFRACDDCYVRGIVWAMRKAFGEHNHVKVRRLDPAKFVGF